MSTSVDHLADCLTEKGDLLENLVATLQEEKGHITGLDTEGVEACRLRKLQLMARLEDKSSLCRGAIRTAGSDLGLESAENLSAVIGALASSRRERLAGLQERLLRLGDDVSRANSHNRDLLYGTLRAIRGSLEFYDNTFGKGCTYGDSGRMDAHRAGGRLVSGEI